MGALSCMRNVFRSAFFSPPEKSIDPNTELKISLWEEVNAIRKIDPDRATTLTHLIIRCQWTRREVDKLAQLGLDVKEAVIQQGLLGGGIEEPAFQLLAAGTKVAITFLRKGNKADIVEFEREQDRPTGVQITLPNGTVIQGTHTGKRKAKLVKIRFAPSCLPKYLHCAPLYTLETDGKGEFQSSDRACNVQYNGNFRENLFHDQTGNAKLFDGTKFRYTGSFINGNREGSGVQEVLENGVWFTQFTGEWQNNTPWNGVWKDSTDSDAVTIKEGFREERSAPIKAGDSPLPEQEDDGLGVFDRRPSEKPLDPGWVNRPVAPLPPSPLQEMIGIHPSEGTKSPTPSTPEAVEVVVLEKPSETAADVEIFGKRAWVRAIGAGANSLMEPEIPPAMLTALDEMDPYLPREKIRNTHRLLLIPNLLSQQSTTLSTMMRQVDKTLFVQLFPSSIDTKFQKAMGSIAVQESYWILVRKLPILHGKVSSQLPDELLCNAEIPTTIEHLANLLLSILADSNVPYVQPSLALCHERFDLPDKGLHNMCLGQLERTNLSGGRRPYHYKLLSSAAVNNDDLRVLTKWANPTRQILPQHTFGPEVWSLYNLHIDAAPKIPPELLAAITHICPHNPGKKVHQTHLLCLVPGKINIADHLYPWTVHGIHTLHEKDKKLISLAKVSTQFKKETSSSAYWILVYRQSLGEFSNRQEFIASDKQRPHVSTLSAREHLALMQICHMTRTPIPYSFDESARYLCSEKGNGEEEIYIGNTYTTHGHLVTSVLRNNHKSPLSILVKYDPKETS